MEQQISDIERLREFVQRGDQRAFAAVARRHLDLVYATALRKIGDAGAAEEVAQNVLIVLARKAWQFAPEDSLPAWLHRTTLFESKEWLRGELRRRRRIQTAAELGTTMKSSDEQPALHALLPLLDNALLSLREKDRTALLLRFYEGQSLREVGAAFGLGEDAAQKRVQGALEKLSQFFQRRGYKTVTVAACAAALKRTAVSASAATAGAIVNAVLQMAPPPLAGLTALLGRFAGLPRAPKVTVFLAVAAALFVWLWDGKPKGEEAALPAQLDTGQIAVATRQSQSRRPALELADMPQPVEEAAPPQRYVEITAELEQVSYPADVVQNSNNAAEQNFSVVCTMGTNAWRIDPSFGETGTSQWLFDGTNIYNNIIALGAPRPIGARIRPGNGEKLAAITNSSVHLRESRDGCPHEDTRLHIPWLAFCSGTYLKREGRLIPLPVVTSLRHAPDGFAYSDTTETFEDELGLPRRMELFASDSLFAASVTNGVFVGKRDVELWKRGSTGFKWDFPHGALRFHYAVTRSTNFLGWTFPVEFEWFRNEHDDGQLVTRCRGRGKVLSIRVSERPRSVMTGQSVVDWRFRDDSKSVNGMIYTSTNLFAAPTNDPVLQEKFRERVERSPKKSVR